MIKFCISFLYIYFFNNIFYWFFHIVHYNIENWVWNLVRTRTLVALGCMLSCFSSLESIGFLGDYPQLKCHSADIEILLPDLSEAVTPQTIPQFWPPDSLDYSRELILIRFRIQDLKNFVEVWYGSGSRKKNRDPDLDKKGIATRKILKTYFFKLISHALIVCLHYLTITIL